jgi:HAE1 family hydrophobic/amphiphilic exporter-1
VEFAKLEYESGKSLIDASLSGARLRLRPILMTAFAFILGCVPLYLASGAGSISRQVLGTAVIGGMLASTVIAIFFVPVFFVVVEQLGQLGKKKESPAASMPPLSPAEGDQP